MEVEAEKLLLIKQLIQLRDVKVLHQVRELLQKEANPIVGYDAKGNPISKKEFVKDIEVAEKEYVAGNFQSIEEVEKESESW
jgi:hypothetical protein